MASATAALARSRSSSASGSGLNLNVHFHTLVFDGVFRRAPPDGLAYHPAILPRDADVAHVLDTDTDAYIVPLTQMCTEP